MIKLSQTFEDCIKQHNIALRSSVVKLPPKSNLNPYEKQGCYINLVSQICNDITMALDKNEDGVIWGHFGNNATALATGDRYQPQPYVNYSKLDDCSNNAQQVIREHITILTSPEVPSNPELHMMFLYKLMIEPVYDWVYNLGNDITTNEDNFKKFLSANNIQGWNPYVVDIYGFLSNIKKGDEKNNTHNIIELINYFINLPSPNSNIIVAN